MRLCENLLRSHWVPLSMALFTAFGSTSGGGGLSWLAARTVEPLVASGVEPAAAKQESRSASQSIRFIGSPPQDPLQGMRHRRAGEFVRVDSARLVLECFVDLAGKGAGV